MNKADWQKVMTKAEAETDLSTVDTSVLYGCGLPDFKPVVATVEVVAAFVRYQALQLNGQWDNTELNNLNNIFRHKVTLING